MKQFKLYNNIVGWLVFVVAAITYLLTIEPTASFWDCGEFIASAYKLEVGHPPGAPFFMLTARIFALFASDPSSVAMMVNAMSALCSAFTILFLFWTISHLARKVIISQESDFSGGNIIGILGAAAVGALAYTFSDTFWFSAAEGEVYAYSSLFTAVVFWCILKWEDADDQGNASRWLILIAYLMGLSIGVHLLNLLAIPAIVLVYYFKKHENINAKGILLALAASGLILLAVLYGLIPGFTKVAGVFELFFVNTVGLPYNVGLFIYLIISFGVLIWAIWETSQGKHENRIKVAVLLALILFGVPFLGDSLWLGLILTAISAAVLFIYKHWNYRVLHTIMMCMAVILIGYSSYAILMIRSAANTPMDQNSPEDVFALQSYLNREQYGDRPLFYGAVYSAPEALRVEGNRCIPIIKEGKNNWVRPEKTEPNQKDKYLNTGRKFKGYETDSRFDMLFPRMYSSQEHHVNAYKAWADVKGERISVDRCGNKEVRVMPTFGENLKFFFSYQVNFMYWRYFMWNFAGRQNDIQSHGELEHGNWISGISFLDNARLGDQNLLPESLKNNKGHNTYFMLPLLLGIIGIFWQFASHKKGKQSFWLTFALFFLTGLAIVIYLNQTPYQPRERDYAYAGSFYAFCIWIGLGVLGVAKILEKALPKAVSSSLATILCLGVPALMAAQNWDDHDRSDRYLARDMGANYLNTCAPNAILFCNGDNDTFPVWFNQEVEGNRTDVRSCNLSYLSTDWYIDQMKRGAYESAPLPITWEHNEYMADRLNGSQVVDHKQFGGIMPLATALDLVRRDEFINNNVGVIFASKVTVPVDKAQVIATGTLPESDSILIVPEITIPLGSVIGKPSLMVLEMINSNNWERPIYFSMTVGDEFYPALQPYLQQEGAAYRLVPAHKNKGVNTEVMYENLMHRFKYGNVNHPGIYLDETNMKICRTLRVAFSQLAEALILEGDSTRALEVLAYAEEQIPQSTVPYDFVQSYFAQSYYQLGNIEEGDRIMQILMDDCTERIEFVLSLPKSKQANVGYDMQLRNNLGKIQNIAMTCQQYKSPLADTVNELFQNYYKTLAPRLENN